VRTQSGWLFSSLGCRSVIVELGPQLLRLPHLHPNAVMHDNIEGSEFASVACRLREAESGRERGFCSRRAEELPNVICVSVPWVVSEASRVALMRTDDHFTRIVFDIKACYSRSACSALQRAKSRWDMSYIVIDGAQSEDSHCKD
jgi:hypothetical protein